VVSFNPRSLYPAKIVPGNRWMGRWFGSSLEFYGQLTTFYESIEMVKEGVLNRID